MYCIRCGAQLTEAGGICPRCASPEAHAVPAAQPIPAAPARGDSDATAPAAAESAVPEEESRPWWVPPFWQMPPWEMENQLDEYETMAWHRSYRKISAVLTLFIAVVATVMSTVGPPPDDAFVGLVVVLLIYVVLAALVYRGNRGAIITMMILVTFNQVTTIVMSIFSPLTWAVALALWLFLMERFYRAWCVENARRALRRASA